MPAYLIGDVTVKDQAGYDQYRGEIEDPIARHGGEYVVRGGKMEVVSGEWRPNRLIVVRFPSKEAALAYLDDPMFHQLGPPRRRAISSQIVLVEGVESANRSARTGVE